MDGGAFFKGFIIRFFGCLEEVARGLKVKKPNFLRPEFGKPFCIKGGEGDIKHLGDPN